LNQSGGLHLFKNDPLISFVIPVYHKKPEVFEKCLKSLFDMSYKAIEVICVFDGEDKDLEQIASKYKTQRITIEHGGASHARNEGYKVALGTYVSFWDADCYAKPEMAKRWIQEFKASGADFVYSGYEFVGHTGVVPSHPFDPFMLTCGNYIATMCPLQRDIFPGFDETLKAAQDWDLWLTLAQKGYRGSWIAGEGFLTEPPDGESISGQGWNKENYRETFRTVADKHGIPVRDIVIASEEDSVKGSHVARLIGADFHTTFDFRRNDYKLAIALGISFHNVQFTDAPADCVKCLYWRTKDIEAFEGYGLLASIMLLEKFKEIIQHHYCNEMFAQKRLKRIFDFMGLPEPEIVPLPSETDEAETKLPETYRVLLSIDEMYLPVFKTIKQDLPYIIIDELDFKTNPTAAISDYSLLVSFQRFPSVDEGIRRFLINGRNVISNVPAPYCGNFDMEITMKDFKQNIIRAIRDGRHLKFNKEAQDYYKAQVSPDVFANKIKSLLPQKLEVLA
jgi:glycosyltransferase involved in cell wall biosynthesis